MEDTSNNCATSIDHIKKIIVVYKLKRIEFPAEIVETKPAPVTRENPFGFLACMYDTSYILRHKCTRDRINQIYSGGARLALIPGLPEPSREVKEAVASELQADIAELGEWKGHPND